MLKNEIKTFFSKKKNEFEIECFFKKVRNQIQSFLPMQMSFIGYDTTYLLSLQQIKIQFDTYFEICEYYDKQLKKHIFKFHKVHLSKS